MKDAETTKNVWSCACVALDEKYLSSFVYELNNGIRDDENLRSQSKHISDVLDVESLENFWLKVVSELVVVLLGQDRISARNCLLIPFPSHFYRRFAPNRYGR